MLTADLYDRRDMVLFVLLLIFVTSQLELYIEFESIFKLDDRTPARPFS